MRSVEEVNADLVIALELSCDEPFKKEGFVRRKGSSRYIRNIGEARQTIDFDADFFPRYQPDAEVHIHPSMSLSIKPVSEAALDLVGGNKMLLANAPELIFNQPIDLVAPKETHVRWFSSGFVGIQKTLLEITSFVEDWVVPFFDELRTPDDVIKLDANKDERVLKQRHWYLFVAGAHVLHGNKDKALAVLESNFRAPGLRKRYSVAFESLEAD